MDNFFGFSCGDTNLGMFFYSIKEVIKTMKIKYGLRMTKKYLIFNCNKNNTLYLFHKMSITQCNHKTCHPSTFLGWALSFVLNSPSFLVPLSSHSLLVVMHSTRTNFQFLKFLLSLCRHLSFWVLQPLLWISPEN